MSKEKMSSHQSDRSMRYGPIAALSAISLFVIYFFSELVPDLGHNVASDNLRMDWLLAVIWAAVLGIVMTMGARDRREKGVAVFPGRYASIEYIQQCRF